MRDAECLAQHSGWRTVLSVFDEQAEDAQAGVLRKSGKRGRGLFSIHMSRIMDIIFICQDSCPCGIPQRLDLRGNTGKPSRCQDIVSMGLCEFFRRGFWI